MSEQEEESIRQRPFSAEEDQVDGRGEELADRRAEGQRRARVRAAVADYLGNKKRKRK